MTARRKRYVFLPLAGLAIAAATLLALGYTGVLNLPWTPGAPAEALASEGAADSSGAGQDAKKSEKKKNGKDDEEEVIPVPVELARVEPRPISAYYRASSFIEADRHVELVAKTAGRVRTINVEEGDWVEEGEVLAELENDRERIQLRQMELKVDDQKRELERRESLLAQKLITQEEFHGTRSAFDLAQADRDLAGIGLEETLIRAPFAGQVTDRLIVPGQYVSPTAPLFNLVDLEPLRIRVSLPEAVARKIRPGERVQVSTEAVEKPIEATVERVAPIVDPTTSTVRLTLLVEEGQKLLRVGGFVKVRITTDTRQEALSIPKRALVEEGGLRSVFVADADSVRKVEIRTGLWDETHVEVLDGLEETDWVVSVGQGGLRTGSRIDVLNAGEVGWVAPVKEEGPAAEKTEEKPQESSADEEA